MQQNENVLNTRNILIILSYDGSRYHGWQVQKNALTVQEVFQNALEKIINQKADIKGLLIPYIAGCVIIFGSFAIWKLIVTLLQGI